VKSHFIKLIVFPSSFVSNTVIKLKFFEKIDKRFLSKKSEECTEACGDSFASILLKFSTLSDKDVANFLHPSILN